MSILIGLTYKIYDKMFADIEKKEGEHQFVRLDASIEC